MKNYWKDKDQQKNPIIRGWKYFTLWAVYLN